MSLLADAAQNSGQYFRWFICCDVAGFAQRLGDNGRRHHFVVSGNKGGKVDIADAVNDVRSALAFVGKDSEAVTFYPPRRESPSSWSFSSPMTSTVIR